MVLLIASCTNKLPSRDERCREAADHLAAVSTSKMPEDDRRRVVAACMTWTDATLTCLLAAKDDADIDHCGNRPSREERCRDAADHLAAISTAPMPEGDRKRLLAACMTWPPAALACRLAAKDDADIEACGKTMRAH